LRDLVEPGHVRGRQRGVGAVVGRRAAVEAGLTPRATPGDDEGCDHQHHDPTHHAPSLLSPPRPCVDSRRTMTQSCHSVYASAARRAGRGRVRVRRRLLIVLAVVALAGCSMWTQGRADGGRSGNNPQEQVITAANVGGLTETSHIVARIPTDPVVNSAGILAFGGLAYDLNTCGPSSCHRTLT